MTNQNTKNMCLFSFLLTFSGKDLDQKHQKTTRLDKVKVRSTAVKPELIESFPRVFWLIITQETPRFMCLFPCLLSQVENRVGNKKMKK